MLDFPMMLRDPSVSTRESHPFQDVAMGGKAKPTKHTAKELAQKERAERVRMSAFEAQMDE